jgi:type VI secretion system protein ImpH
MAETTGTTSSGLELLQALAEKPHSFDFFQALRRLENLYSDKPRIGTSSHAAEDPVRLAQEAHLVSAPSTLAAFEPGAGGALPRLTSYFFGLLGPNGPLPLHLTEFVRERHWHHADPTMGRFLDLFHHRMLSLFYRAWAINEPTVSFDRPDEDSFGRYLGALFGLGMPNLRRRDRFPDEARLHYAGLFAAQTRHAAGLESVLAGYFGMPVRIEQFQPAWMHLPEELQWRLGSSPDSGILGQTTTPGARVWGCHQKFRICFGPLSLAEYERLLPGGDSMMRLVPLVRFYAGDELTWDVNLILKREEIPRLQLGRTARLGWTSWGQLRPPEHDADDLKLNPLGAIE